MRWRVVLRVDPNPAIGEALNDWHTTHDSAMVAFFQEWPFGGSEGVIKSAASISDRCNGTTCDSNH